ncbi:ATP-binding protein [Halobellus rufus]|uniref:ATP-binding protein n=1 Tax=Halobellus rufus TaxID=1448860 RepID=UPI00373FCB3B
MSVRVVRADDTVVVSLADDGPGIPEMEREAAGGATGITPLFHGSGLGLQFVYHVAKRSGGTVRFDSADGDGGGRDEFDGAHGELDGALVVLTLPAWDAENPSGDGERET